MSASEIEQVDTYPGRYLSSKDILEATRALGPKIAAMSQQTRDEGRLPAELMEDLRTAGVFRAAFPAIWGGPEMGMVDQIELIEEIARNDASTAWATMILFDSGFFAGNFPGDVVREVYPSMDMGTAVSQYPLGRADADGDGYRISGRFKFGSGTYNADVFGCPCHIYVGGEQKVGPDGKPDQAVFLVPAEHVTIHDTWDVIGLQGTGSTDYEVKDVYVPATHTFVFDEQAIDEDKPPLSRHHRFLVFSQFGVLLGLTRHILDELQATVEKRIATSTGTAIKDDWEIQVGVPEAEAMWGAARAYVYEFARETDEIMFGDRPLTREHVVKISMVGPALAQLCRMSADKAIELVGTDAIQASRPWEQLYQDLRVAGSHVVHRRHNYRKAMLELQR